jgi:hypothetical protein
MADKTKEFIKRRKELAGLSTLTTIGVFQLIKIHH